MLEDYPDIDTNYVRVTLEPLHDYNCVGFALNKKEYIEPQSAIKVRDVFVDFNDHPARTPGADIDLLGTAKGAVGEALKKVYVTKVTRKYTGAHLMGVPTNEELWESKLGPYKMAITHRRFDLCRSGEGMTQL